MASSQSKLALKKEQLAILSKFWLQFSESASAFIALNVAKRYRETSFQLSVLLKSVLDELEEKKTLNGAPHAEQTYAAVLLNAEFLLINLNPIHTAEELRYNPFLRHWANVVMRCQSPVLKALGGAANDPNASDNEVAAVPDWWATAQAARLELVKCAFGLMDILDLQFSTPNMLVESAANIAASPINLGPILAVLKNEGLPTDPAPLPQPLLSPATAASFGHAQSVIRPPPSSSPPVAAAAPGRSAAEQRAQAAAVAAAMAAAGAAPPMAATGASASSTAAAAASAASAAAAAAIPDDDDNSSSNNDEDAFLAWLAAAPGDALAYLVRLPPTLPALDLATKILASPSALPARGVAPADVAREHLQHALRAVEAMGPGGGGARERRGADGDGDDGGDDDDDDDDGGRRGARGAEGQARAVALLVVYLRNLIASGVLPLDRVWLDVQEVCVRYIWLPQVREFRAWLEGAVTGVEG